MRDSAQGTGRRGFLNWLLGTSGAALLASAVYPIARFISPPRIPEATASQVEAGPTNDPQFTEKGYKIIRFGVEPVIVVRLDSQTEKAYCLQLLSHTSGFSQQPLPGSLLACSTIAR